LEDWGPENKDELYKALKVAGGASEDNNVEEDLEQDEEEPPTKKVIVKRMGSHLAISRFVKRSCCPNCGSTRIKWKPPQTKISLFRAA
jgi:hypothetical protein